MIYCIKIEALQYGTIGYLAEKLKERRWLAEVLKF
jgi:hypothetical protein